MSALVRAGKGIEDRPLAHLVRPGELRSHPEGILYLDPMSLAIFRIGAAALPALAKEKEEYPRLAELIDLIESKHGQVRTERFIPPELLDLQLQLMRLQLKHWQERQETLAR